MLEFALIALVVLAVLVFVLIEYGKSLQETEQAKREVKEHETIEHERVESDAVRRDSKRVQSDYID